MEDNIALPLPADALIRGHFERDTIFTSSAKAETILEAYGKACREAARSAHHFMRFGGQERLHAAQWNEAVASTLQAVLESINHHSDGVGETWADDELRLPKPPDFK